MLEGFEQYQKTAIAYFRDYIPGESLSDIKVCSGVVPCAGGKIGVDPSNTIDQWYISPEAVSQFYTKVEAASTAPAADEATVTKPAKPKTK